MALCKLSCIFCMHTYSSIADPFGSFCGRRVMPHTVTTELTHALSFRCLLISVFFWKCMTALNIYDHFLLNVVINIWFKCYFLYTFWQRFTYIDISMSGYCGKFIFLLDLCTVKVPLITEIGEFVFHHFFFQ